MNKIWKNLMAYENDEQKWWLGLDFSYFMIGDGWQDAFDKGG